MKKSLFLLLVSALSLGSQAQINAFFARSAFNTPDNKPYLETYLSILGNSVSFKKNEKGKYQGNVEVGILLSQNGQIKASKKYNLLSPEQKDTLNRPPFIDQQRFQLDTGSYDLELLITDKNMGGKTFTVKNQVKINFPVDKVNISDIELLSSFTKAAVQSVLTKNGYDLVPYASNFLPENAKGLSFYAEVYNSKAVLGENEKFIVSYYIESYEKKIQLPNFSVMKKEISNVVNVVLAQFDISNLPSGNYDLVIEVRNKINELVSHKSIFLYRKNPHAKMNKEDISNVVIENTFASRMTGKDTIADHIRSLRPIASESEQDFIDNQLKLADEKLMQQFFYNFWRSRNQLAPEEEWNKYYQDVKAVNAKFNSFQYKGYETDRGRVYLQYGKPDKMDSYPREPNAFPYEIWLYYRLTDKSKLNPIQTNKQFIFYDQNLSSENYQLLHSDALSELHNANWNMKLHSRTEQLNNMEQTNPSDHYGDHAGDEFAHPK